MGRSKKGLSVFKQKSVVVKFTVVNRINVVYLKLFLSLKRNYEKIFRITK